MQEFLQESFPFLLTKRSVIDLAIVREMRDNLVHSKGVTLAGLSPESYEVPQPGAVERLLQNSGWKRSSSQRRFEVRGVLRPERIRRLHPFRALLAHRMGRESVGPARCETG